MRVLHIGEYVKGGVATYVNNVLNTQKENGAIENVYLALSDYNSEQEFNIINENVYRYKYKRGIPGIFFGTLKIRGIIKEINPDIIHLHSTFAGLMVRLLYICKRKKVKIVYCPHGWAFIMDISNAKKKLFAMIEKFLSLKTDKIINISDYEYEEAKKFGLNAKKMTTIKSGIDLHVSECKENDLSLDKELINLLYIGRFDRAKGIDIIFDLMKNHDLPNIKLYTIGDSVLADNEINIPRNVVSLGWIDNSNIDSYIKKFDAVIMPSRWEGFGLVALEGMKNGKAIICSNKAALPELVQDGVNGYHIDIESEEDMVKVLNSLDKDVLEEMGRNGYNILRENFTSQMMNEQIINLYTNLISKKK